MLWATNWVTHNAFGFSADALAGTGSQTAAPDVVLNLANVGTNSPPTGALVFSSNNDAWIGTCKNSQKPQVLAKFKPAKLAASGTPAADVQITLPGTDNTYDCASALAFDAGGNLWVGMYRGHILRYNASDLAASGTPTPAVTLTNTTVFNGIADLIFNGDTLIVGAYYQPKISILSAAQLAASDAALVPAISVTLPAGAGIGGLALGAAGSIWVADYNHSSLLQFGASALTSSGTPAPNVTLTGVPGPEQLSFDKLGNLWVASFDASKVYAFAAADIAASGAPTPLTTFTGDGLLNSTYALRFSPTP
jgi:ligand-binding sensor domain-containing protein